MPFNHQYLNVIEGEDGITVSAQPPALRAWAKRPGHEWPLSQLAKSGPVLIGFDHKGDLITLEGAPDDLSADELDAFVEDVCGSAHPVAANRA